MREQFDFEITAVHWICAFLTLITAVAISCGLVYLILFGLISFVTWNSAFMDLGEVHGIIRFVYAFLCFVASVLSIAGVIDLFFQWTRFKQKELDKASDSK